MDLIALNSVKSLDYPIYFSWTSANLLDNQNVYLTNDTVVNCSFSHSPRFLGDPVELHLPQPNYDICLGSMEERTPKHEPEALQSYDNNLFSTSLINDLYQYDGRNPELADLDNFYAVDISSLPEPRVDEVGKETAKISEFIQQTYNTTPVSQSDSDSDLIEPGNDMMKDIEIPVEGEWMTSGTNFDNSAATLGPQCSPQIQSRKVIRASRKNPSILGGSERVLRSMKADRKAFKFE